MCCGRPVSPLLTPVERLARLTRELMYTIRRKWTRCGMRKMLPLKLRRIQIHGFGIAAVVHSSTPRSALRIAGESPFHSHGHDCQPDFFDRQSQREIRRARSGAALGPMPSAAGISQRHAQQQKDERQRNPHPSDPAGTARAAWWRTHIRPPRRGCATLSGQPASSRSRAADQRASRRARPRSRSVKGRRSRRLLARQFPAAEGELQRSRFLKHAVFPEEESGRAGLGGEGLHQQRHVRRTGESSAPSARCLPAPAPARRACGCESSPPRRLARGASRPPASQAPSKASRSSGANRYEGRACSRTAPARNLQRARWSPRRARSSRAAARPLPRRAWAPRRSRA